MTEVNKASDPDDNKKRKKALRDQQIISEYAEPDATAKSVAEKHGVSEILVRKIVAGSGIQKPKGRKKNVADPDAEKSLSPLHRKIGVRLTGFLRLNGDWTYSDAAEHLGWPTQKVSGIGRGTYDPSLMDLAVLANFMEISINKLMDRIDVEYDLQKTPIALDPVSEAEARIAPRTTDSDDGPKKSDVGYYRSDSLESPAEDQ